MKTDHSNQRRFGIDRSAIKLSIIDARERLIPCFDSLCHAGLDLREIDLCHDRGRNECAQNGSRNC